jgi:hypothetical protein
MKEQFVALEVVDDAYGLNSCQKIFIHLPFLPRSRRFSARPIASPTIKKQTHVLIMHIGSSHAWLWLGCIGAVGESQELIRWVVRTP